MKYRTCIQLIHYARKRNKHHLLLHLVKTYW